VSHADAAFNVGRAALLGAGIAGGNPELLAAAFEDRLHEPYRPSLLLDAIRGELPAGAVGATLSGSGPTVIAWADDPVTCAAELQKRFPEETVMVLPVSSQGAH
jgi:homoserine kinase